MSFHGKMKPVMRQFELKLQSSRFKHVVTFLPPFDGTKESYEMFSRICDIAFESICEEDFSCLLNFVLCKFIVNGINLAGHYKTWFDLKSAANEHFQIRHRELTLLRELNDMKINLFEELFSYYNRLISKCQQYCDLIKLTTSDDAQFNFKVKVAEDIIRDKFFDSLSVTIRVALSVDKFEDIHAIYEKLREFNITGIENTDFISHIQELRTKTSDLPSSSRSASTIICSYCSKPGHLQNDCFKYRHFLNVTSSSNSSSTRTRNNRSRKKN